MANDLGHQATEPAAANSARPGARPGRLAPGAHKGLAPFSFGLLAVIVGVVAGFGALFFRGLIALFHNLFFFGRWSFAFDTDAHTPPSPFGIGVALAPALGAVIVVFLVRNFAPEAKGHGVPEVMDAIYYKKAVIRPIVAFVKSVASAISIGSGGAVGREGPIIQIGAAFGSWIGRVCRVSRWQLATLVAAGGGAGIAATFNTPIGGVLFALEVLMHEVSVRTLVPVALATATATYIGRSLFGTRATFAVPALHMPTATGTALLPAYLALGGAMAIVSVLFIRALYGAEDLFERWIRGRGYLRHVLGMLGVGILAVALMRFSGHYYVQGVGYATIIDVLTGALASGWFLVLLFALKLLATSMTLGSGASGGIFSPSLFMGATLGGACGIALRALFPSLHIDPAALALAGMAGLVAGATGAALTAIVMIFEMTLDYAMVLPMTLTVAVSYGLRRLMFVDNIYTMKLTRRGHYMPQALQANAQFVHHVAEIVMADVAVMPGDAPPDRVELVEGPEAPTHVVLMDADQVAGILPVDWALAHAAALRGASTLADVAQHDFVTVSSDTTLFDVLARLQEARASVAVVLPATDAERETAARPVLGIVTKAHLAEAVAESMELFED